MRNLLLSAFALVCLLPMNAQTVNTRIYPAEKLAKVKAKADAYIRPGYQNVNERGRQSYEPDSSFGDG